MPLNPLTGARGGGGWKPDLAKHFLHMLPRAPVFENASHTDVELIEADGSKVSG